MSQCKWTPGPWEVEIVDPSQLLGIRSDEFDVVSSTPSVAPIRRIADANLIAAAPELYGALHQVTESLEAEIEARYPPEMRKYPCNQAKYEADMQEVHEARAALSKARGEDQS